jgi:hypothetical protein
MPTAHAQEKSFPSPVSVTIDSYRSIQKLPIPTWLIKEGDTPLTIEDILNRELKDGQILYFSPDEVVINHFGKYWFAVEFASEVDIQNWLLHVENTFTHLGFIGFLID